VSPDRYEPQRGEWHDFLEQVTKEHEGDAVTIEVMDSEYGDQFEAEQMPFAYLEYDDKDDAVNVGVGGKDNRYPVVLRHTIERPKAVLVDPPAPNAARTLEIAGDDGSNTIVSLHRRPALPPPD
jgi:hypothetical protein